MASNDDIPMTAIVTKQPVAAAKSDHGNAVSGNGTNEASSPVDADDDRKLTRLGPLRAVNQLRIKQKIRLKDICGNICGCEVEKKYAIQGPEGDTLYWAKERSACAYRCLFENIRPLTISVEDQTGNEVFNLRRPLNCSGCCCWFCYPHCTQKLAVSTERESIGFIRERATWCFPVYHLFDSLGAPSFKIRGPCCHFACCSDVTFSVLRDQEEVATITKKWLGVCQEAVADIDHFVVDFKAELNVEEKAMVMAAAFLIDLMYYEGDSL